MEGHVLVAHRFSGGWRLGPPIAALVAAVVLSAFSLGASAPTLPSLGGGVSSSFGSVSAMTPALERLALSDPGRKIRVIVQLRAGTPLAAGRALATGAGATGVRDVRLINAVAGTMPAEAAWELTKASEVRAISLDAPVKSTSLAPNSTLLRTSYNESVRTTKAWEAGHTGKGIGVAVIDTGIAGGLADFRDETGASRVVASAVVNPVAQSAGDTYGHGTHVAGLIAGNGLGRDVGDPLKGFYAGGAPEANLIDIKADDGHGATTLLDVIDGLQFAVDFKDTYNVRVVNLSLRSTVAESYRTDPLDAAVEAAWFSGIVVVAAAGNDGSAPDAVSYAPANDPYVITVGGVDDMGTKTVSDDRLAAWSSRGVTQDGFQKPELLAPGAHLVSNLAPGSDFAGLCPTCVTDGEYFKVGGTSMAAAVTSGAVATVVQAHPTWTPDQIKGTLVNKSRPVHSPRPESGAEDLVNADDKHPPEAQTVTSKIVGGEVAVDKVLSGSPDDGNVGLQPSTLIDPNTHGIDYSRASWSRASWSQAGDAEPLRASWSRASWSRASWSRASWSATPESCSDFERASWSRASWSSEEIDQVRAQCASVDTTRASWSRASWSRASWSTSFDK